MLHRNITWANTFSTSSFGVGSFNSYADY